MQRTDAVVLGAGIVGASVALHLAKRRLSVALVDRRGLGEETSYGNAGVIEGNTIFPPVFPSRLRTLLRWRSSGRPRPIIISPRCSGSRPGCCSSARIRGPSGCWRPSGRCVRCLRRPPPSPVQLTRLLPAARALCPLAEPIGAQPWMGCRPCLPDSRPVIGRAPGHTGLWLAVGHAHWGLTLGPATGRMIAEMMTDAEPFCDHTPYRAERFAR
jgi:glycine/D-amino acid oxidase-like deaminating enzyme